MQIHTPLKLSLEYLKLPHILTIDIYQVSIMFIEKLDFHSHSGGFYLEFF